MPHNELLIVVVSDNAASRSLLSSRLAGAGCSIATYGQLNIGPLLPSLARANLIVIDLPEDARARLLLQMDALGIGAPIVELVSDSDIDALATGSIARKNAVDHIMRVVAEVRAS